MYKRCFLHIMASPPPTRQFFCSVSKHFCRPVCVAAIQGKCSLRVCAKGGERSPGGAGPEIPSALGPNRSGPQVGPLPSPRHFQSRPPKLAVPVRAVPVSPATKPPLMDGGTDKVSAEGSIGGSALHPFAQKVAKLQGRTCKKHRNSARTSHPHYFKLHLALVLVKNATLQNQLFLP